MLARVFQGSTDTAVFEDFIEQLLHHCGRWPEPKSVLIMDNASFHHSTRIEQLCREAGVKLLYLPPYSPDLNPIEEFFTELKMFIKRNWQRYTDDPGQDFKAFLRVVCGRCRGKEVKCRGAFPTFWAVYKRTVKANRTNLALRNPLLLQLILFGPSLDTEAYRIAFRIFARTSTLSPHQSVVLGTRFTYLSLAAVRSTT